jgi:ABC-type phosphate/phosphonate transport system substrate-binding protein
MGLCLAAFSPASLVGGSDTNPLTGAPPLRIALSEKVVCGVNLNDARASMAIWAAEMAKTARLDLTPGQNWVLPSDQLEAAVRGGRVDLFCLTVQEYRRVIPYVDTSHILSDEYRGEELLLMVREEGGVANLADLRGKSLLLLDSPYTSLTDPWLAVSLARAGLESPDRFFGRMTRTTKLAQVVLPVFFGQADACVVTGRGFQTMTELNPQLSRKLKVLLASPKTLSAFFAWRKDFPERFKKPIFDRLLDLRSNLTARQVFTLFQSPGFAVVDAEGLRPANALLDAYERLREPPAGRKR